MCDLLLAEVRILRLRRLHPDLGVEIIDFDVANGRSPEDVAALRDTLDEHELLLFRGDRPVSPERHLEICSWFGPCNTKGADGTQWTYMDNAEAIGRDRLMFHSDVSYAERPMEGISLHALELPKTDTTTAFVSGVAAWAGLSHERQVMLAPMTARHRLGVSMVPDWPEFVADKPVCMTHPRTGRPVLYVTEYHAERIHELAPGASDRILAELFAHLYAPEHVYLHTWQPHDLIVWDNLAVQHARPEVSDPAHGVRKLQRVTIGGQPFEEILAAARRREQEERARGTAR